MKESEEKPKREHKKNWRKVIATVEEIKDFLGGRLFLRYNVITGRVECKLPSNYETDGTDWQPVSDRIVNSLWAELSKKKSARAQDIYRVIESDFAPEYHPFRYYLEHLPPWDGKEDHIFGLSLSVNVKGDADEQLLFAEYLKKWLVGMVAGWIDNDAVNNVVLVLLGEQGSYKTTWLKCLMPPELKAYAYLKADASRMKRDDLLKLAQYGLVCCEATRCMLPSSRWPFRQPPRKGQWTVADSTSDRLLTRTAHARSTREKFLLSIVLYCPVSNNQPLLSKNQPSDNKRGEKRKNRCKSGDWDGNCGMMRTVDCNLSTV